LKGPPLDCLALTNYLRRATNGPRGWYRANVSAFSELR
jgi:hypothetical protein